MLKRRTTLALLATAGTASLTSGLRAATDKKTETIAVIGTGEVGGRLGKRWAELGHKIVYGSRTPGDGRVQEVVSHTGNGARAMNVTEASASAELILLAVPWMAAREVVTALGNVGGKILIDPTNSVKKTDDRFEAPPGMLTSDGEEIQAWASSANVVKAFNTLSVEAMTDAKSAGGPISVPLAGADAGAKARVAQLVQSMGMEPVDVGGIYLARYLEGMARLRMTYRLKNKPAAFEFYLRPRRD